MMTRLVLLLALLLAPVTAFAESSLKGPIAGLGYRGNRAIKICLGATNDTCEVFSQGSGLTLGPQEELGAYYYHGIKLILGGWEADYYVEPYEGRIVRLCLRFTTKDPAVSPSLRAHCTWAEYLTYT